LTNEYIDNTHITIKAYSLTHTIRDSCEYFSKNKPEKESTESLFYARINTLASDSVAQVYRPLSE